MYNSIIIGDSLTESINEVKTLLNTRYSYGKHLKDRMSQRGIKLKELNKIIDNCYIEEAKNGSMKGFKDGLVYVFSIQNGIKSLITCYRSKSKKHNIK